MHTHTYAHTHIPGISCGQKSSQAGHLGSVLPLKYLATHGLCILMPHAGLSQIWDYERKKKGEEKCRLVWLLVKCASWQRCGHKAGTNLEHDVATDVTLFHLVLVHCSDVSVHLDNTSGGQHVFTPFLNVRKTIPHKPKFSNNVESELCSVFLFFYKITIKFNEKQWDILN